MFNISTSQKKKERGGMLSSKTVFFLSLRGDVLPDARFPQRICEDVLQEDHCTNDEQVLLWLWQRISSNPRLHG